MRIENPLKWYAEYRELPLQSPDFPHIDDGLKGQLRSCTHTHKTKVVFLALKLQKAGILAFGKVAPDPA